MVDVLLFAEFQEKIGKEKLKIEADGLAVKDLKEKLLSTYEELDNMDNVMIAINEEYVNPDTVLKNGDVVAFIPPVSGG